MKKVDEINALMYVDKKRFIQVTATFLFLGIVLITMFNVRIALHLLKIYYIIISFVVLLLIFSDGNSKKKSFFYQLAWIFMITALFNMQLLVLNLDISLDLNLKSVIREYVCIYFVVKNVGVFFGISAIVDYYNGKVDKLKEGLKFILIAGAMFIFMQSKYGFMYRVILIGLLIIINNYYIIKMKKTTKGVNYVRFYMIAFSIKLIISGLVILLGFEAINWIDDIIMFVAYSNLAFFAMNKLINLPYKIAEKQLNTAKSELNLLNKSLESHEGEILSKKYLIDRDEKNFKMFFKKIPVPLVIISSSIRKIIGINEQGMKLFSEDSLKIFIGKDILDFTIIEENKILEDKKLKLYHGMIKKNKRQINIGILGERGNEGEIILILTDVTSKVQSEKIKYEIEEKKIQEEMKKKFLANISHDLKTPVNVIYSSMQVQDIFIKNKNIKAIEKYCTTSKDNCLALKRLTNNIIDIGKIDLGFLECNLTKNNIVSFVEDRFLNLVEYTKDQNINMTFDTNEEEIYVNIDVDYMERIILNVISNAVKYNKENGDIFLNITGFSESVELRIKDTGIGIKKEFLDKIFERYSMTGQARGPENKSSGIGMYVVKKLVEVQGGSINIDSKEGIGTTIKIRLKREHMT